MFHSVPQYLIIHAELTMQEKRRQFKCTQSVEIFEKTVMDQVTFEWVVAFESHKVFTSEERSEESQSVHRGGIASGGHFRV